MAQDEPTTQGAFYTNTYRNVLGEIGISDEDIQARIDEVWQTMFYGDDDTERIYYPVGDDMAYIADINNDDVRSEGMSYGMMIAVQLDKQDEFNRLWTWAKTYMYHPSGQYEGYFSWQNSTDGSRRAQNPASDGEIWFTMALFFAAARWGNGEGIYNYQAEANAILNTMLHTEDDPTATATNTFNTQNYLVVFVPELGRNSQFTDPSYIMPHYFDLWALWADEEADHTFWQTAAHMGRELLREAAHPETGLMPNYANWDGSPHASGDYGEFFYADAWRCAMNVAMDYSWFAADEWQVEQSNRLLNFFYDLGINTYNTKFYIDGTPADPQHRSTALVAANAVAALAATDDIADEFVQIFWDTSLTTGQYRYYDNLLYMMALLQLSGNFRIYDPTATS
jgi:oligosaccharide reducing-end xylanase